MKPRFAPSLAAAALLLPALSHAEEGLYYIGSEAQESLPLKWVVGANLIWDDNVTPTALGRGRGESATSINPYVGLSFVNITPTQSLDVFARVGASIYFDSPSAAGADDINPNIRVGVNWTRRFSERLRFSSRNFLGYELEPNYAYGFATNRQTDPYLFYSTDNSIGYRWTERFATYTGFRISGLDYDSSVRNNDRFTWELYNQFRYQLTPQTVATFDYRYAHTEADGLAADSTSHFLLLGVEHRFSPNTILVAKAGAQIRESDAFNGNDSTNPFVELAVRSRINEVFSVRGFLRYSAEVYDTTRTIIGPGGALGVYDFDDRQTLRMGVRGDYQISQKLSVFGGVDYIPASFDDGRLVGAGAGFPANFGGLEEDLFNVYLGLSVQITDYLYGSVSYNYTDSSSDFPAYTYDRNRVSIGLRAEFE